MTVLSLSSTLMAPKTRDHLIFGSKLSNFRVKYYIWMSYIPIPDFLIILITDKNRDKSRENSDFHLQREKLENFPKVVPQKTVEDGEYQQRKAELHLGPGQALDTNAGGRRRSLCYRGKTYISPFQGEHENQKEVIPKNQDHDRKSSPILTQQESQQSQQAREHLVQIALEYRNILVNPNLPEHDADRLEQILDLALIDEELSALLNSMDCLIDLEHQQEDDCGPVVWR